MLVCTQSALGWDHQEQLSKHESQTDAAKGFGGKYGVQKESQDKVCEGIHVMARHCWLWHSMFVFIDLQSALGWDYQSELSKHGSQTDATKGFGGRYGVQKDRQDDVSGNQN